MDCYVIHLVMQCVAVSCTSDVFDVAMCCLSVVVKCTMVIAD